MLIFDFEQEMMECWTVVNDIQKLREYRDAHTMSEDQLDNYLLGLETIYDVRFQQLQAKFEELARQYHEYRQQTDHLSNSF